MSAVKSSWKQSIGVPFAMLLGLSLLFGCDNKSKKRAKKADKQITHLTQKNTETTRKSKEQDARITELEELNTKHETTIADGKKKNAAMKVTITKITGQLTEKTKSSNKFEAELKELQSKHDEVDAKIIQNATELKKLVAERGLHKVAHEKALASSQQNKISQAAAKKEGLKLTAERSALKKENNVKAAQLAKIESDIAFNEALQKNMLATNSENKEILAQSELRLSEFDQVIAEREKLAMSFSYSNSANLVFQAEIQEMKTGKLTAMPIYLDLMIVDPDWSTNLKRRFQEASTTDKLVLDILVKKIIADKTNDGLNVFGADYGSNIYSSIESGWQRSGSLVHDKVHHHQFLIQAYPSEVANFFRTVNALDGTIRIPGKAKIGSLKNFKLKILLANHVKVTANLALFRKERDLNLKEKYYDNRNLPGKFRSTLPLIGNLPFMSVELEKDELFGDDGFVLTDPQQIFSSHADIFANLCPQLTAVCFGKMIQERRFDVDVSYSAVPEKAQRALLYDLYRREKNQAIAILPAKKNEFLKRASANTSHTEIWFVRTAKDVQNNVAKLATQYEREYVIANMIEGPISLNEYIRLHLLRRIQIQVPNYINSLRDGRRSTKKKTFNRETRTSDSGQLLITRPNRLSDDQQKALNHSLHHIGIGFTASIMDKYLVGLDPNKVNGHIVSLPLGDSAPGQFGSFIFSPTLNVSNNSVLLNYFASLYETLIDSATRK